MTALAANRHRFRALARMAYLWYTSSMPSSYQSRAKIKLSAAIFPWTVKALDDLRRRRGLRSRSEAVAEALAEWAAEWRKDGAVAEAVARYGTRYAKAAEGERSTAAKLLPVSLAHRKAP